MGCLKPGDDHLQQPSHGCHEVLDLLSVISRVVRENLAFNQVQDLGAKLMEVRFEAGEVAILNHIVDCILNWDHMASIYHLRIQDVPNTAADDFCELKVQDCRAVML